MTAPPTTWEDTPEELAHVLPADFDECARIVLLPAGYAYGRDREATVIWARVLAQHPLYRNTLGTAGTAEGVTLARIVYGARDQGVHFGYMALGLLLLKTVCDTYAVSQWLLPCGVDGQACRRARVALDRLTPAGFAALGQLIDWCLAESAAPFAS